MRTLFYLSLASLAAQHPGWEEAKTMSATSMSAFLMGMFLTHPPEHTQVSARQQGAREKQTLRPVLTPSQSNSFYGLCCVCCCI